MPKSEGVIYREVQRTRHYWIWAVVLLVAALFWYGFIQQIVFGIPFGNKPVSNIALIAVWILCGVAFPALTWQLKLVTEVRTDGLYVRFLPFHLRFIKFPASDIRNCELIVYSPIRRFGGWGIRWNWSGERAYTMNGNEAVEIRLTSGEVVVIGSERPMELKAAIHKVCLG